MSVRFAWTASAAWLAYRITLCESESKPIAQTHSRCSSCLGERVSACRVVNTGQSASFNTFAVVEPKQHPPEEAGVCWHDDEIESVCTGELGDLCRCRARQQDSRALSEWKLSSEEGIQPVTREVLLLFGNLGNRPYIELNCVMTVKIEDVNQCYPGPENSRRPLHVSGHGHAGRREVDREQNVLERRPGFGSHSGFSYLSSAARSQLPRVTAAS
jgi:hypothetical protein